jgi:hypothetical protein
MRLQSSVYGSRMQKDSEEPTGAKRLAVGTADNNFTADSHGHSHHSHSHSG